MTQMMPVILDAQGRPYPMNLGDLKQKRRARSLMMGGFKGAQDPNLNEWVHLPLDINDVLRNDLRKLRARSRDLARNDDTAKRFLNLLKQNVLGHAGIVLQAKNKLAGSTDLDVAWNEEIEREYKLFCKKRRRRGLFESPYCSGQLSLWQIAWLVAWTRAIDGEVFIQVLRGYPHNRHRFAVRFLNADLLDSTFKKDLKNGNRVEMGIELDEYDRPVAYHFTEDQPGKKYNTLNKKRKPIPADQIIHIYRHEFVGQLRGIPDFATIMPKVKMLGGVHEALVVGWRVAAAKMGFFTSENPDFLFGDDDDEDGNGSQEFGMNTLDAIPGTIDKMPYGLKLDTFDPEYPNATYESGNKVFMQQLANGLNVSSPTLANNYEGVNYSSLRQATLEDREGWRCLQTEMIDDFYQPLFDDWYDWQVNVTGLIKADAALDPAIVWQPRGWPWVDPLKEVNAQVTAVNNGFRTRQSVIAETSGDDFLETADALAEEKRILEDRGLQLGDDQKLIEIKEEKEDE